MPSAPSAISKSDAKPCCAFVPSWCGLTDCDQVLPSSREYESRRSYASIAGSTDGYVVATSVPSRLRITVGTSASVTNQPPLDAIVFAAVHELPVSSENFNVAVVSVCSSQLRTTPRSDAVSCG